MSDRTQLERTMQTAQLHIVIAIVQKERIFPSIQAVHEEGIWYMSPDGLLSS